LWAWQFDFPEYLRTAEAVLTDSAHREDVSSHVTESGEIAGDRINLLVFGH